MRIGIRPTVDVVFKCLFGSPEHANLTRSLINSILSLAGKAPAQEVEILNPFRLAEFSGDKEVAVDVRAKDEAGREFQVEMQVRNDGALIPRMLDNWARLYTAQIKKGEDYRRHRPVISIWILGTAFLGDREWFHAFRTVDRERDLELGEDFLLMTIELPKLPALPKRSAGVKFERAIDEWLWLLLRGETIDPESADLSSFREETREAVRIMAAFTKQEKARHTYERRLEWERTINAWKTDSRAEGLAEGRAEGRELGRAEGLELGRAEGRAKGHAEGRAEGHAEGESAGRRLQAEQDARRLLELGVDPAIIFRATRVRVEDIDGRTAKE